MRLTRDVADWFDHRLQLGTPIREAMEHRVPRNTASWAYVFGSASLTVMILQFVTGICLAFVYVPSAGQAWTSLQVLNHQQSFGWFIRALHGWGSNFMVALVLIHMVQVFLFGAFKYPRELTWMVGVLLLLMTLGMAFTGQVLRFDQDAYWGLGIGASIMGRVPLIGTPLVHAMLGGPIIAGETLSRFFSIHVFIVPGALLAFVGVHLLMVLKLGINEWPMPGRIVKRSTYLKEYHELTQKDGVRFVPDAFRKDLVFSGLIILALVACATFLGPFGPKGQPDPTVVQAVPRPDYFFLWMYAALALQCLRRQRTQIALVRRRVHSKEGGFFSICQNRVKPRLRNPLHDNAAAHPIHRHRFRFAIRPKSAHVAARLRRLYRRRGRPARRELAPDAVARGHAFHKLVQERRKDLLTGEVAVGRRG